MCLYIHISVTVSDLCMCHVCTGAARERRANRSPARGARPTRHQPADTELPEYTYTAPVTVTQSYQCCGGHWIQLITSVLVLVLVLFFSEYTILAI